MKILQVPNPKLRKKTKKVGKITPEIKKLANEMINVLADKGVALSANQVGSDKMVAVFRFEPPAESPAEAGHSGGPATMSRGDGNLGGRKDKIPKTILINPEIIWQSKEKDIAEEGCLSFVKPEIRAEVERPKKVKVKALDISGKEVVLKKDGLFSRALQHEIDHLNGILFTDKANPDTIHKVGKGEIDKESKL